MLKSWTDKGVFLLGGVALCLAANTFLLLRGTPWLWAVWALLVAGANLLTLCRRLPLPDRRLRVCCHSVTCLRLFLLSTAVTAVFHLGLPFFTDWKSWLYSVLVAFAVEAAVFWNGMICVYLTCYRLGVHWRALGLVCGLIPIVNVVLLVIILRHAATECVQELDRAERDARRAPQRLCDTRYPLLLVHGVFFRDFRYFNYWGRIPTALKHHGARIYYGNHESAATVEESAVQLAARVRTIIAETGCEKVNIIAHSKGGLDCRYAMAHLGLSDCVASLTTINTPHRGCLFADFMLEQTTDAMQRKVAKAYNAAMRLFGEKNTDFMAAVRDLTTPRGLELDGSMPLPAGVYCQSIGSRQGKALGGRFPLNFTYAIAKHCGGHNDGLVDESSFQWGENYRLLVPTGDRGISHGDMIDLNRENIPGFDVREFYVELVSALKEKGL